MDNVNALYEDYWHFHSNKIDNGYTILEIAAVSLACALSIYKTTLSEDDFNKMMDFIDENRNNVKKIIDENTIH